MDMMECRQSCFYFTEHERIAASEELVAASTQAVANVMVADLRRRLQFTSDGKVAHVPTIAPMLDFAKGICLELATLKLNVKSYPESKQDVPGLAHDVDLTKPFLNMSRS